MKKIYFIFSFLLILFISFSAFIYFLNLSPLDDEGITIFKVERDWGVKKIAHELRERNIIKSNKLMVLIAYLYNSDKSFKEGIYNLSNNLSTLGVYRELVKGSLPDDIQVTIPEGYTSRRIAFRLKDNGIISDENEFLSLIRNRKFIEEFDLPYNSLEGLLFPDTYKFYKDMDTKDIIRIMVNNLFFKLENIGIVYKDFTAKKFYDNIILASIVEREYRNSSEVSQIASVFINRININMALQSCATIEYIITEELLKPHPKRIFFKDLEINSDYNTYIRNGYPPTPISNSGIVALKSVFFPEKTNYLFFVVDNPKLGTHKFSSSYSDHLASTSNYLRNFVIKD